MKENPLLSAAFAVVNPANMDPPSPSATDNDGRLCAAVVSSVGAADAEVVNPSNMEGCGRAAGDVIGAASSTVLLDMKPNALPAGACGCDSEGAAALLSLDATYAAEEDGATAGAEAALPPMDDCKNEKPLLAGGAAAGAEDSSLESPFIERPPNMILLLLLRFHFGIGGQC